MKRIEAIIKPFKLEEVRDALLQAGVQGMTVFDAEGIGRQRGHKEIYRGSEYTADMLPKVKLKILVAEENLEKVLAVIVATANTGKIGDGKVFVTSVENLRRIRTGESDRAALD